jgi:hypothetical protein
LREIGKKICTVMMFNLAELEKEKNHADFHGSGGEFDSRHLHHLEQP